jgi:hypothetical protein
MQSAVGSEPDQQRQRVPWCFGERVSLATFQNVAADPPSPGVKTRSLSGKGNAMNLQRAALALALSSGAALMCGAAYAESARTGTPGRYMKAIDTDHDGTIDLKEVRKAASAHLRHLDKDGDNTLDMKEMSRLGLNQKAFARADPDKDNTIDKREYLALVDRQFKAADPDNDGTLSSEEINTSAGRALMRLIAR